MTSDKEEETFDKGKRENMQFQMEMCIKDTTLIHSVSKKSVVDLVEV